MKKIKKKRSDSPMVNPINNFIKNLKNKFKNIRYYNCIFYPFDVSFHH